MNFLLEDSKFEAGSKDMISETTLLKTFFYDVTAGQDLDKDSLIKQIIPRKICSHFMLNSKVNSTILVIN